MQSSLPEFDTRLLISGAFAGQAVPLPVNGLTGLMRKGSEYADYASC